MTDPMSAEPLRKGRSRARSWTRHSDSCRWSKSCSARFATRRFWLAPSARQEELSQVADESPSDTIYAIDRVSEELLIELFEGEAPAVGGIVLVAGGGASKTARWSCRAGRAKRARAFACWSTRSTARAGSCTRSGAPGCSRASRRIEVRGTRLSDIVAAAQTEIPILKQNLADELWAIKGKGAFALRTNVQTGEWREFALRPSRATGIEHGFAMLTRFFHGGRDVLARLDDELVKRLVEHPKPGRALCLRGSVPVDWRAALRAHGGTRSLQRGPEAAPLESAASAARTCGDLCPPLRRGGSTDRVRSGSCLDSTPTGRRSTRRSTSRATSPGSATRERDAPRADRARLADAARGERARLRSPSATRPSSRANGTTS